MPLEITDHWVFDGPNIFFPQPGLAAHVRASFDLRQRLSYTLKTWAQSVGVIIGYLRIEPLEEQDAGALFRVRFTCNYPQIGMAMLQCAVADLQAEERQDADWSHDEQLFDLRRQRMRAEPGLPLLQLRAEAQRHGLPVLPVGDGRLQIGTGAAAWRFDPTGLSVGLAVDPPWSAISVVPLIAVSGSGHTELAAQIADALTSATAAPLLVRDGTFSALQEALLDPQATCVVAALNTSDALYRGLAFTRCLVAVVGPLDQLNAAEALAAGLPALVADETGAALLAANEPQSAALAERIAAQPVLIAGASVSAQPIDPLIAAIVPIVQSFWGQMPR